MADNRYKLPMTACLSPQNTESVLCVVEGHAFHNSGECLADMLLDGGIPRAGS
jgi:hypothetical protein